MKVKETGDPNTQIPSVGLASAIFYAPTSSKRKNTPAMKRRSKSISPINTRWTECHDLPANFGLKFQRLDAPYKWVPDLQLYAVVGFRHRRAAGPLLSPYVSRAKANTITSPSSHHRGQVAGNGKYQRPTVALICKFPVPPGRTSRPCSPTRMLKRSSTIRPRHAFHFDSRQVFPLRRHEVPRDFVEAPSANAENWVWDKKILGQFCGGLPRSFEKRFPTKY